MQPKEAFKILGLAEGADRTEIRHAYADFSKTCHVETDPEGFSRLHEAYKTALAAAGSTKPGQQELVFHPVLPEAENNIETKPFPKDAPPAKTQVDNFLDRLLGRGFSIQNCSPLTQLLYYRCRYDEMSSDLDAVLLRITNAEQGIMDDASLQNTSETANLPPDGRKFMGIPWKKWKTLNWTCIVCHPAFYRVQDTPAFLDELCRFLSEEMLNLRDGIRQELYFALCMAYGFFLPGNEKGLGLPDDSPLAEIEKLLGQHPRHSEYEKDLALWPDCQQARHIVRFCHETYESLMPLTDADTCLNHPLPEAAAQLLLDDAIPWMEFIYDHLADVTRGRLLAQFNKKREDFQELHRLREEFTSDFINLLNNNITENYIYNDGYVPLVIRLGRIRERYLTNPEWKKIICRPSFFDAFQNWLFPRHNGFSSVPCLMHYDTWKMLRTCFAGSSDFEASATRYLTTKYYFPEYEKRYQKELVWESAHIEEAYFKEAFPVPALSQGKLDLLNTIKNAVPVKISEIEKIWGNLTYDSGGLDFLARVTNALTHFNFLLVTQKREKEAIPGDAFCFLEDEVLLYRKKENLFCRLTHPVFYDLISWKFEAAAYPVINGKPGYDEDFLNTACRNLYCYRCYAASKIHTASPITQNG